jgi:hypothetical protein
MLNARIFLPHPTCFSLSLTYLNQALIVADGKLKQVGQGDETLCNFLRIRQQRADYGNHIRASFYHLSGIFRSDAADCHQRDAFSYGPPHPP